MFGVPPECYKTEVDLTKQFPKCCPAAVCPGDANYKKH